MTTNDKTPSKGLDRKVECVCGVILELRTQGLYCPPCRAKNRSERKRNMDASWRRRHQRHSQPTRSDTPDANMEALIDAIDRLVGALESGRKANVPSRPSTSLVLPTRRAAQPRRVVGIPTDRLEAE